MKITKDEIKELKQIFWENTTKFFRIVYGPVDLGLHKLHEAILEHLGSEEIIENVTERVYTAYIKELLNRGEIEDFLEKVCKKIPKNEELKKAKDDAIKSLKMLKEVGIQLEKTTYQEEDSTILSDKPTFNQIIGAGVVVLGAFIAFLGAIKSEKS